MQFLIRIFSSLMLVQCVVLPLLGQDKPAVLVFGGNRLYVGMSKHDAAAALAKCCKLSPPAEPDVQKEVPAEVMAGHFIFNRDESNPRILGVVYFSSGKIVRVTHALDDDVDTFNDDLVGFARALSRSLSPEEGDSEAILNVYVRHQRMTNAESTTVSLLFPNGRGVEIQLGTLDKPSAVTGKRDFANLDEILERLPPD